jgi:hypothetical protein
MNDDPPECSRVIDCAGLHEIGKMGSDNRKGHVLAQLESGAIAVATCAWKEFAELYEEEAVELESHVTTKIKLTKAHTVGAAALADKLNSGFPPGPYDENTDLYTASIATKEGYQILTSPSQLKRYKNMNCKAQDVETWLDGELDE